jgi:hypothetical protein
MGAAASTANGLLGPSTKDAEIKHDMITRIFQVLFSNANDIDISKLANPRLCQRYVFHLQRAIQDMREAEKNNELKFFIVEMPGGRDGFDRVGFHPVKSEKPSEAELCKQMSVFYLELIFFMYACALTTGKQFRPAPGSDITPIRNTVTRKMQRGGASPAQDFTSFIDQNYDRPSREHMTNPELFRQLSPRFAGTERPQILFQRPGEDKKLYFWGIYTAKGTEHRVKFWVEITGDSSDSFTMTFYRCPSPKNCDSSMPVLKGTAFIELNSSGGYTFKFQTGRNVFEKAYGIPATSPPYTLDQIGTALLVAARADPNVILQNKAFITSGGTDTARIQQLQGTATLEASTASGFSAIANDFRLMMIKDRLSLYQIRKVMLTEAGNRVQSWNASMSTDNLRKVMEILARGASHFSSEPKIQSRLIGLFPTWDNLRASNESRFRQLYNKVPELSEKKIAQLKEYRNRLENDHNKFTLAVAKIIESKVMKFDGKNYRINPDFFTVKEVKQSTTAKLDSVVEETSEIMLRYYIETEKITEEAFTNVFSYIGPSLY